MTPNYHFQLLQTLPSPSFPNLLLSLPCALLPTNITWWEFPEKVKAFVNTLPVVTATHPPRRSAPHTGLHGLRATFCFLYSYSHDSEMKWSICEFLPVSILWPVFSHGRYLSQIYSVSPSLSSLLVIPITRLLGLLKLFHSSLKLCSVFPRI